MEPGHFVGMVWAKDGAGRILAARKFTGAEGRRPELAFTVTGDAKTLQLINGSGGLVVRGFAWCSKHGLWASEPVRVENRGWKTPQRLTAVLSNMKKA